jgi:hypothetical protein
MEELLAPVLLLDWNDLPAVEMTCALVLAALAKDPSLIRSQLDQLSDDPKVFALSEHHPHMFDKVVLYSDDLGVQLRLHVFLPGYSDQPHTHRWSFASRHPARRLRAHPVRGADAGEIRRDPAAEAVDDPQRNGGKRPRATAQHDPSIDREPSVHGLVDPARSGPEGQLLDDESGHRPHHPACRSNPGSPESLRVKQMSQGRFDEIRALLRSLDLF